MPTGPHANLVQFLGSLDERSLPQLVADYLSVTGHEQVIVTDGPGDGGRDIHSLKNDKKFLTQCKFHAKQTGAVSSSEISELPVAMLKFGVRQGLFVTTGKISPQAKREFINDYRDFSLAFMDGPTLARTILDNPLLRALWVDGLSAIHVNRAVSFVVIARDMVLNRPVFLPKEEWYAEVIRGECQSMNLELDLAERVLCPPGSLPGYVPPARRTLSEHGGHVSGLGVVVRGSSALREADRVIQVALRAISASAGKRVSVATRATIPMLVPLAGSHAGASFHFQGAASPTLRCGPEEQPIEESLFISPGRQWHRPVRLSGATSHVLGWYNPLSNVVLEISIPHRMDEETRAQEDLLDEQREMWCEKSLFCFLPPEALDTQPGGQCPPTEPSLNVAWTDGKRLVAWLHPYMIGPLSSFGIEPDTIRSDDDDPLGLRAMEQDFQSAIEVTSAWCSGVEGAELLSPKPAVHLLAALGHHLVHRASFMQFRAADILRRSHPSPLCTEFLSLQFTVCWWLLQRSESPEDVLARIHNTLDLDEVEFSLDTRIFRVGGCYLICSFTRPGGRPSESTAKIVDSEMVPLQARIEKIEQFFAQEQIIATRDTAKYWSDEYFVDFIATAEEAAAMRPAK